MKTKKLNFSLTFTALTVLTLSALFINQAQAQSVTINFNGINTGGGVVSGPAVTNYLYNYGISVSGSPSTAEPAIQPSGYNSCTPVSPATNMFSITGGSDTIAPSMTLTFATPLSTFRLTRCAEIYGPNSWAEWSATAYDGATELGSVGEALADAFGTYYPTPGTYSLTAPSGSQITSVVLYESVEDFAGNWVCFDNLVLTPALTLGIAPYGNQSVLFWPASATNAVLQTTTNLNSPNWVTASNGTPFNAVGFTNSLPAQFFRLVQQP